MSTKIAANNIYNRFKKSLRYGGFKFTCNMCGFKARKMISTGHKHPIFQENVIVGAGFRKNAICPLCCATDKLRLVYYYLANYTDIFKTPNKILHFAPELELKRKILKNHDNSYIEADINPKKAKNVIDITNIPFEDNSFDYIICNHVLEHVEDEKQALKELKRVIKPSGKIILTFPVCLSNKNTFEDPSIKSLEDRFKYYCQEDHVRLYGLDFASRAKKVGLKTKTFEPDAKIAQKYAFSKAGIVYILKKN